MQTASLLHSDGDAYDVAVQDGRLVGVRGRGIDRVNRGRLGPKDLGLDAAFNHGAGPVADLLRAAAPEGIDVYFDCVGGDHLEAALGALRRWGRVALCGAVSQYGRPPQGPANLFQATANDVTLRGFRGSSYLHRMADMVRDVSGWLADERLRYSETVVDGLERAPEALARMLAGETIGKTRAHRLISCG